MQILGILVLGGDASSGKRAANGSSRRGQVLSHVAAIARIGLVVIGCRTVTGHDKVGECCCVVFWGCLCRTRGVEAAGARVDEVFRQLSQYSVVLSRTDSDGRGCALEGACVDSSRFPPARPLEEFIAGQRLKSLAVAVRLDALRHSDGAEMVV